MLLARVGMSTNLLVPTSVKISLPLDRTVYQQGVNPKNATFLLAGQVSGYLMPLLVFLIRPAVVACFPPTTRATAKSRINFLSNKSLKINFNAQYHI
jgi:hypothetical protein